MPKTKISEWSSTPANNTDIDSINIAEGCAPSGINDAIRELMSQVKDLYAGTSGDIIAVAAGGTGVGTSTGSGSNVLSTSPTLVTPILGTPSSATLTNATGLPISTGVSGLGTGVATALGVAVGSAGAPVVNGGSLGTPSSGTVTNLTGTASININGTVGATTPTTGAFTTLTTSSTVTLNGGTANGLAYLNASKVLTSGSALTFDGTNLALGVASPTYKLDVSAGNGQGIRFTDSVNSVQNFLGAYNSVGLLGTLSNHPVAFWTNNAEAMRLTSTGLGIGTSSPSSKLEVRGSNNATNVRFGDSTGANALNIYNNTTSGVVDLGTSASAMTFSNAGYEKMRLDSAGNLGLGVTPSAWSTTYNKAIQLPAGSISAYTTIALSMNQNAYYSGSAFNYVNNGFAERYEQYNGTHAWYTAASGTAGDAISFTQALTLDASGNLLCGNTSLPTSYGATSGVINTTGGVWTNRGQFSAAGSTTTTFLTLANASNNQSYIVSVRQSGAGGNFVSAFVIAYGASATSIRFAQDNTNAALDMNITTSGLALRLVLASGFGTTTWDWVITRLG